MRPGATRCVTGLLAALAAGTLAAGCSGEQVAEAVGGAEPPPVDAVPLGPEAFAPGAFEEGSPAPEPRETAPEVEATLDEGETDAAAAEAGEGGTAPATPTPRRDTTADLNRRELGGPTVTPPPQPAPPQPQPAQPPPEDKDDTEGLF